MTRVKRDNDQQKKDDENRLTLLNKRTRDTNKAIETKTKELEEVDGHVRALQGKRRRLDEEIQPLKAKQQELPDQVKAAKERLNESKIVSLLLEQTEPFGCLGRVATELGYRVEPLHAPPKADADADAMIKEVDLIKKELHGSGSVTGTPPIDMTASTTDQQYTVPARSATEVFTPTFPLLQFLGERRAKTSG